MSLATLPRRIAEHEARRHMTPLAIRVEDFKAASRVETAALTASDWSETLCMAVQEQASDARRALVDYFTAAGVSGADAEAMVGGLSC